MFISRLRHQSQRPEPAVGAHLPQPDHASAAAEDGAQPLPGKGIKALAVAEARFLCRIELRARQVSEQGVERQQVPCALQRRHRRECFQRYGVVEPEPSGADAPQRREVARGASGNP